MLSAMRVRHWLALFGGLVLLVNCDTVLGFRDLEVETDVEGGNGGEVSEGGDGGEAGAGAQGGDVGGFGGSGGFGGGFGGGCGDYPLGLSCGDGEQCESCICEDSGDANMYEFVCCTETCAPCTDCNPSTGMCDIVVEDGPDAPSCEGLFTCIQGSCESC